MFRLARELSTTPDVLEEKAAADVRRWLLYLGAEDDARRMLRERAQVDADIQARRRR